MLQRLAGNRALQRVVRSLQRDPAKDDTAPADLQDVRGSGMTRVEVHGLTMGLSEGFEKSFTYTRKDKKTGKPVEITAKSFEAAKTAESPAHMAVVVMPDLIPDGTALQVILHFHGLGYRAGDPYAGYGVAKGDENVAAGTTRDVDQEHWEQQLGAVNAARAKGQPLVVAVLAQGRGQEDFGKTETYAFVNDVLTHVPALSKIAAYDVVLSAHSGGGFRIADRVDQAKTVGTTPLPTKPGKPPDRTTDLVVMFDAEAVGSVAGSAAKRIAALGKGLKALDPLKAADQTTARAQIAAIPRFRFYFRLDGDYHRSYVTASKTVRSAVDDVPEPWRQGGSEVTADDLVRFVAVFAVGVDHEHVISGGKPDVQTAETEKAGSLADALNASLDPKGDRDKAFDESKLADLRKAAAKARADAKAARDAAKAAAKAAKAAAKAGEEAGKPGAKGAGKARTEDAGKTRKEGPAGAPRRDPTRTRRRSGSSTTPGTATPATPTTAPAPATPVTAPGGTPRPAAGMTATAGWRTAGMVADYTYTEKHKEVVASQTKAERTADRDAFDKAAKKKLATLAKKEKKGTLTDGEKTDLADLRALSGRVAAAESALKHKDVEEVLAAAGTDVATWYGALEKGTFLDQSVHVHPSLAARLARAESALVADPKVNPNKLDAAGLGETLLHSVADMRIPKAATGGKSLSMHVFGLAVDLNYKGNPFVGNASKGVFAVVMRATSLVDSAAVDISPKLGDARAAYDTLTTVSRAVSTYLSFTGADDKALAHLVRDHTPAKGEPTDLAGWVKQIEKDRRSLAGGDFADHTAAAQGIMDLDKTLVLALADAGLYWGGQYGGGKDIMHFDLREGDGAAIDKARNAHKANT